MASYSRTVRLRTSAGLIAAVVLVLGAAGCGGDSDDGADGGSDSGGPADAVTVTVDDNFFEPEAVDVATGGTVTWEWVGSETHNVKHDDFESEFLTEGTFEHTFDEAGTYEYMCTVHPGMEGTVNVED
ncbi:MAG: cupredoxin domain-containing protein [Acidimicrobiia bacterium]|nr:cupredoxin domain-containing protein [Acidimicrobiia bacterium]